MKKIIGVLGLVSMVVGVVYVKAAQDLGYTWQALGVAVGYLVIMGILVALFFFFVWLIVDEGE